MSRVFHEWTCLLGLTVLASMTENQRVESGVDGTLFEWKSFLVGVSYDIDQRQRICCEIRRDVLSSPAHSLFWN